MKRFFELHNNVALKFQEIQLKFVDGIGYLLNRADHDPSISVDHGLRKLYRLKAIYEQQLEDSASSPDHVKEIEVCFRCFDKPSGECKDCD